MGNVRFGGLVWLGLAGGLLLAALVFALWAVCGTGCAAAGGNRVDVLPEEAREDVLTAAATSRLAAATSRPAAATGGTELQSGQANANLDLIAQLTSQLTAELKANAELRVELAALQIKVNAPVTAGRDIGDVSIVKWSSGTGGGAVLLALLGSRIWSAVSRTKRRKANPYASSVGVLEHLDESARARVARATLAHYHLCCKSCGKLDLAVEENP